MARQANPALLGANDDEFDQILSWASFANSDVMKHSVGTWAGIIGKVPYNKKSSDQSQQDLFACCDIVEQRLYDYTYLVGESLTLADLIVAQSFWRVFCYVMGQDERKKYPNIFKWFNTIINTDILKSEFTDFEYIEKKKEFVPPKKEKKAPAPKAEQPKKEAAPKAAAEEPVVEEKKPKHPLELLGKPKQAIDEWKRVYSNEETRETAIPWFWKNMYDPEEWSLWKVDYKYNDELTLTFMSNNLVGGFFNRLSASTKYMFGCMVVYGVNNDNGITGFFLVRGQEHEPAFDVAPDWESYAFTKLEPTEENKKFINNMLAWDEPVEVDGKKIEIADGKVFK